MKFSDLFGLSGAKNSPKQADNARPTSTDAAHRSEPDVISQLLMNQLKSGMVFENPDHQIVMANQTFCDIFGITDAPEALVGHVFKGGADSYKHLFETPFLFSGRINQLIKARIPVYADELNMLSGKIVERDYVPIIDGGTYKGNLWVYNDVTARKKYDKALKILVEQYRNITANMNLGLLEMDKNEIIIDVNDIFCNMSGYDRDELIGNKSSTILVSQLNGKIFDDRVRMKKHGLLDIYQVPVLNKAGEERWWLISEAPNFDEKGNSIGSIGIHMDISEQKKMERELELSKQKAEESSKAKEIFLANMSHEIRTPMTGILGMVNLLHKTNLDDQQRKYAKLISESGNNLLTIVNDVLDIEKISAGKIDFENLAFKLEEKVFKMLQTFQYKAEEKNINLLLQSNLPPDLVVMGDPYRLGQIITNLLNNAIKFTPEGEISVTLDGQVSKDDDNSMVVNFYIKDSGIGIKADKLNDIFSPFVQASTETSRKFGGTGLGLTICKNLVEMQHGKIAVTSKENVGTTFSFNIPYKLGSEAMLESADPQQVHFKSLESLRVLVAEDVEINQFLIKHILESWNCDVTLANNGLEAVEKVRKNSYDIILMDIQMPEMDGIAATRMIRTMTSKEKVVVSKNMRTINAADKSAIPIIALTANALKGDDQRYINYGMNGYISKPFTEEKLYIAISDAMNKNPRKQLPDDAEPDISPTMPDNKVERLYDLTFINAISKNDSGFNRKFIGMFIESMKVNLDNLDGALAEKNFKKMGAIAHKMKSNIDSMGIEKLKEPIRQLENCDGETEACARLAKLVKETLHKVFDQLQQFELTA